MTDAFETTGHARAGFRLHKLEVYNWGTFDSAHQRTRGRVYTVRPAGQSTLLIGQNGSGKSTLVDALLTLLVRPAVRNYNVAAGAGKRERDERTYIKGAYGRFSREEDNRADVQFLRPEGSHYSVLLACFRNDQTSRALSVAQVLSLDAEGQPKKLYLLAPDERSIAADCSGLKGMDKLKQRLEKRGFRATTSYTEFHGWFQKATGVQPKAMDMFNQTVAVKDIQRLNDFIRDHMLEARPWSEKVDSLLRHFTELSEAHQSLVRVRKQFELLEPVAEAGGAWREHAGHLERMQRLLDAADAFFRQQVVDLYGPECEVRVGRLDDVRSRKEQLSHEIAAVQDECRRLQNELDVAGGERLREIPRLIRMHEAEAGARRGEHGRFHEALRAAGIDEPVASANELTAVHERLRVLLPELETGITAADARRNELIIERGEVIRALGEDQRELEALGRRQSNLPETLAAVRWQLCEELRLPEKDLPFAAELMSVAPEERDWEPSIEMALRPFALSLLVPERQYALVSAYADRTRLRDTLGRGQRLVYLKVGRRADAPPGPAVHPQSLLRKLAFREGHPLLPWVRAELAERFDYRCCESVEEFQQTPGRAMTRERHVHARGVRHEKDDRDRAADPRHFVLGWDNRDKRRRLAEEIERLGEARDRLDAQISRLESTLADLRRRKTAAEQAQQVTDFASIDFAAHEHEIAQLRLEQQALEAGNDAVQLLKQRLAERQAHEAALAAGREQLVGDERELENWIREAERLIASARRE
ncbi:MAG TPA: ATP-binding protein, partial [Planctomycetaceae bacterium]|nr:ATP-binding protein [Planctomycetaceae bacterium]